MFSYTPEMTDSAVRRFIVRVGIEHIEDLFKLRIADQMAISGRADTDLLDEFSKRINGIISSDDALSIKDLAIGETTSWRWEYPRASGSVKRSNTCWRPYWMIPLKTRKSSSSGSLWPIRSSVDLPAIDMRF